MTMPVRIVDFGRQNLDGSYPDTPLIGPALVKGDLAANSFQFSPGIVATVAIPSFPADSDFAIATYIVPFASAQTCVLVGKLDATETIAAPFALGLTGGNPSLAVGNGASEVLTVGTAAVPAGLPSALVANCFRGSISLYLNAELVGEGVESFSSDAGELLRIGNINGLMAEVQLYSGALSRARIKNHFALAQDVLSDSAHYTTVKPPAFA